jgi:hypothetical protein
MKAQRFLFAVCEKNKQIFDLQGVLALTNDFLCRNKQCKGIKSSIEGVYICCFCD